MNSNYNRELRVPSGTRVVKIDKISFECDTFVEPPVKYDFRDTFGKSVEVSAKITSEDMKALSDMLFDHYSQPDVYCYVSNHMYWQLQYAAHGKRYPRPRKCKSNTWRDRMQRKMERA